MLNAATGDSLGAVMGERKEKSRQGPLGRETYFNAAMKILADAGFQALTVDNLSAELGATKGSFYHHFAGMPEFTQALVAAWEAQVSGIFGELVTLPPMDGMVRSMALIRQWPMQTDAALRSWACANPLVADAVRRQEATWERLMLGWMAEVVPDPERARLLTHMALALCTGLLQLQRPADPERVHAICAEFVRNNIGLDPQTEQVGAAEQPARHIGRRAERESRIAREPARTCGGSSSDLVDPLTP